MEMKMKVDTEVLKHHRTQRAWTQQQLADLCDVSLRTIQRVEKEGIASAETVAALSAVLELEKASFIRAEVKPDKTDLEAHTVAFRFKIGLLLVSQFIGLAGIWASQHKLSEQQYVLALALVSGGCLLSLAAVLWQGYKQGVLAHLDGRFEDKLVRAWQRLRR
ncbi:helix-turn-helix transcriptional regulator [Ferrimonas pelagia]|uniref:HTH cro/C1-type domain-containing protein n=1 Tax=Ferrimonas pelagia TaxID=1177826 RepID=A0ABP9FEV0_9GAMM